jgi:predicted TIM-barrel fold metal-dependent hydrolase
VSPIADPDTVHAAMAGVDKAIVFSLRYADLAGIDGDDEVTARAVRKYPDKFVGFAAVDPRRSDYMDLLREAASRNMASKA